MPIVHFTNSEERVPEGAENVRTVEYQGRDYILWDSHTGLCLRERERNMHDDSDFYMLVWDEETESTKEICFASTRGWTYPSYASKVDATPEVVAKWEAYEEKVAAEAKAVREAELVKRYTAAGLTEEEWVALSFALGSRRREDAYLKLLTSDHAGRLRSEFKKSLSRQIRAWFTDRKYPSPLSPKQERYI